MLFKCSANGNRQPFPHYWEHTIGSGHATLALRADWQQQLLRCHAELGFKHVRFHGILSDDVGTLVNEMDKLVYSFFNADQICDYLLSIGMRPFMELSFMPYALSSGNDIVFHYKANVTPPRDYDQWGILIYKLVSHWVERYGIEEVSTWFFEIWNEPNLSAFWTGSQADYFKLYEFAAFAIRRISTELHVGGPATADNAWIPAFIENCRGRNVPLDFISTHHYPTDDFGQPGDDTVAQLAASRRSALRDEVKKAKDEAGDLPLYYTEWSTSSNPFDLMHDMPYAAAFISKTVMEAQGYVNGYSYWTFSDIFEENYFCSIPFHGGFGLMNIYGIPKPAYRAYQLLHNLGDELFTVAGTHETIDVWITQKGGTIKILVTNSSLPKHPVATEIVQIELKDIKQIASSYIERIDDSHANAYAAWVKMGQPDTLLPIQVKELEVASELVKEAITIQHTIDSILIELSIDPQGTACITLETL
jgi:xylan 1,4-beta-xylosidase